MAKAGARRYRAERGSIKKYRVRPLNLIRIMLVEEKLAVKPPHLAAFLS